MLFWGLWIVSAVLVGGLIAYGLIAAFGQTRGRHYSGVRAKRRRTSWE